MSKMCFCSISLELVFLQPVIFLQICNRVMTLDNYQTFDSAQYLENKCIEFHQFVNAFIFIRSGLRLLPPIFCLFVVEL